jgi:HEPN domain-containing protein
MDKATLQNLAELRLQDAAALLNAGRWDAAYYMAGYCIECALKACAAKRFLQHVVPERDLTNKFYTHDFNKLVEIAGLLGALNDRQKIDVEFRFNWNLVSAWNESKRYDIGMSEGESRAMLLAVSDKDSGVLTWLRTQY